MVAVVEEFRSQRSGLSFDSENRPCAKPGRASDIRRPLGRRTMRLRPDTAVRERLFFAPDLHGSDLCCRKALAAPQFYSASRSVIGGDLPGKALVPLQKTSAVRWRSNFRSQEYLLETERAAGALEQGLPSAGVYPWRVEDPGTPDDQGARQPAFRSATSARLSRWVEMSDGKPAGAPISGNVAPGNDDETFVDEMLAWATRTINGEGRMLEFADGLSLASRGRGQRNAPCGDGCSTGSPRPQDGHPRVQQSERGPNLTMKLGSAPSLSAKRATGGEKIAGGQPVASRSAGTELLS